jgi:hypothetical protein
MISGVDPSGYFRLGHFGWDVLSGFATAGGGTKDEFVDAYVFWQALHECDGVCRCIGFRRCGDTGRKIRLRNSHRQGPSFRDID